MALSTIKDVAKLAGVSPGTVSRVLNQSGYCSETVREAVLSAAKQLEYKPNSIARSLKKQSTSTIGLILTDITNPFFAGVAKETEKILSTYGYNLIICNTDESAAKERQHLQNLYHRRVDGILLCTTGQNNDYIKKLVAEGMVIVLIDRKYPDLNLDIILDDNQFGAYLLTKHLIQKGHHRIGLIRGNPGSNATLERQKGFARAIKEFDIAQEPELLFEGGGSGEHTMEAVSRIMEMPNRPSAIIALNPLIARHAIMALNSLHVEIPKEMALACFGLEEFKTLYRPSITCIIQRPDLFGFNAAELLLQRIQDGFHGNGREIVFSPELFEGSSV